METEQHSKNNNQNSINRNNSVIQRENGNRLYVYVLKEHGVNPNATFPHNGTLKQGEKIIDSHVLNEPPPLEANREYVYYGNYVEGPMTCTTKHGDEEATIKEVPSNYSFAEHGVFGDFQQNNRHEIVENNNYMRQRTGRKQKFSESQTIEEFPLPIVSGRALKVPNNAELSETSENRQTEVLKAAKSLFSKRTRTLFHWMHPNTPKAQLKAAIASSWETLGEQEKDFYISQVLGRFGFSQTNLMVNPQLGLSGILSLPTLNVSLSQQERNLETSLAVSSILVNEPGNANESSWRPPECSAITSRASYTQRKRKKLGRPPGSKNRKFCKREFLSSSNQPRDESSNIDEFRDDPELNREFQQFQWALQLNDGDKAIT